MKNDERTNYKKCKPDVLYEARKIVIKMWKKDHSVKEIAEITGFTTNTVYITIRKYKAGGMNALKPKKRGIKTGENRTLSSEQEKEVIKMITEKNPDQLRLKCCLWTRYAVQELIKEHYGITMPIRTVGEYLRRWGFTVQRPMKQAMNQKPKQVQEWLKNTYPSIHTAAKEEGAEIFWGDETAIQNESNYARGYAPKGKTPVLKVQTVKLHINMIRAISNRGKVHFMFSQESINSEKLIDFMERLIKDSGHKIYLILDNLRAHHSKAVTAWVEEHKEQIALFHLPPYSPEYNPDEYLNHDLKQSIGHREMVKDKDELQLRADEFMDNLASDSEHVKSYFEHPKLDDYDEI